MNERVSIFANLATTPAFETKPKQDKPIAEGMIDDVARQHNFPSREAKRVTKPEKRTPRRYRTGRNVQFNAKLTAETSATIYKLADEISEEKGEPVALGELLKLAMDALKRERAAARNQSPD